MKRFIIFLLMAVSAVVSIRAQYGQHVIAKTNSGDSIHLDVNNYYQYLPQVRNGKPVWVFKNDEWLPHTGYTGKFIDQIVLDDVQSLEWRTQEEDSVDCWNALVELYKATDGDHWNSNRNWCSDKPFDEWDGISKQGYSYIRSLRLVGNNLKGELPNVFSKLGPLFEINLNGNPELTGTFPASLSRDMELADFQCTGNNLYGNIPIEMYELPKLKNLYIANNDLSGEIPAEMSHLMDKCYNIAISGNDFSGKVPEAVTKHPRFEELWDQIIPQKGHLEIPTIPAYTWVVPDAKNNKVDLSEVYRKNKYTLIYNFAPFSGAFTDKIIQAYRCYHDKGFEVVGMLNWFDGNLKDYLNESGASWINIAYENWDRKQLYHSWTMDITNLVDSEGNIVFTSLMDDKGVSQAMLANPTYHENLFPLLENLFGKIDLNFYTSTDYSKDGEVMTLQKATVGQGVDIVFVGNGFVDKDMDEGGKYETKMKEAMEEMFHYEPMASLRDRFNVYAVKAVSANQEFLEGASHAIESTTNALEYAQKVTSLIPDRPMRVNVVYNHSNAGQSMCNMMDDGSYVAFLKNGVDRNVIAHEACGHGIGRLYDEYVACGAESGMFGDEEKTDYEKMWTDYGRGANIDWNPNLSEMKWAKFAADSRYTGEEYKVYEGAAAYYGHGVYRPTRTSIMVNTNPDQYLGFNAPSREAIYKYVMQESEGADWQFDYETFVAFDEKGRTEFAKALPEHWTIDLARTRSASDNGEQRMLPPTFIKGTWRDLLAR